MPNPTGAGRDPRRNAVTPARPRPRSPARPRPGAGRPRGFPTRAGQLFRASRVGDGATPEERSALPAAPCTGVGAELPWAAPPPSIVEDEPRQHPSGGQRGTATAWRLPAVTPGAGYPSEQGSSRAAGRVGKLLWLTKPGGCAASPGNRSICLIMLPASKSHFHSRLNLSNLNFQAQL